MSANGVSFKYKAMAVILAPLLIISLFGGALAYHEVPAGHIGVEKEWSAVNGEVHESGQAWTVPVKESVEVYSVQPRTYTMSKTQGEGSKAQHDEISFKTVGGIEGTADITVRYRLEDDPESAKKFARDWETLGRAESDLIRPTIRSSFREEAGGISPDEIMTESGRIQLEDALNEALSKEFQSESLVLEAVQVRRVTITDKQYMQSLREKKQAEKQLEVEQVQIEKEKKIAQQKEIQAEADAEVIEIKGESLRNNPSVLQLRYIEALEKGEAIYVGADNGLTLTKEVKNGSDSGGNSTDDGN